jgi:hypothetical protein
VLRGSANYKTIVELWLETLRDEYEQDSIRSPLEQGILMGETRSLDVCFSFAAAGALQVLNSAAGVTPLRPIKIGPRELGLAGLPTSGVAIQRSTKARALETVVRWNTLNARLAKMLDNPLDPDATKPGKLNDMRLANVLVARWAKLGANDSRNLSLTELGKALGFNRQRMALLKSAGIEDLRALAQALQAAPAIERHQAAVAQPSATPKKGRAEAAPRRAPVPSPIDPKEAAEILKDIGKALFGPLDDQQAT